MSSGVHLAKPGDHPNPYWPPVYCDSPGSVLFTRDPKEATCVACARAKQSQKSTPQRTSCDKLSAPEKSERDREIEIIERKLKSALALVNEGLNRLKELKAA